MDLDPATLDRRSLYRIGTTAIVPRPIGWLSTCDSDGIYNVAPFSSFTYLSHDPLVVGFSTGVRDDGRLPDTTRNVLETEELVFNLVTEESLVDMKRSSESIPSKESEFDRFDIEHEPSTTVAPPRVAASPVCLECVLYDTYEFPHGRMLVMAKVVHIHIDDDVLTDGEIDAAKIDAVGRIGGPNYTSISFIDSDGGQS